MGQDINVKSNNLHNDVKGKIMIIDKMIHLLAGKETVFAIAHLEYSSNEI